LCESQEPIKKYFKDSSNPTKQSKILSLMKNLIIYSQKRSENSQILQNTFKSENLDLSPEEDEYKKK